MAKLKSIMGGNQQESMPGGSGSEAKLSRGDSRRGSLEVRQQARATRSGHQDGGG
ncbi:hypothetical protein TRIUR3_30902 [Triticum urartu]|uniref:Uncharacterized protein n=1 Tax=Triticum urartu TaxID=4572 RepID=M7Z1S6_TRIUA|nr:hypothetical protein TRIUR3_30902 [Triticum urartu]